MPFQKNFQLSFKQKALYGIISAFGATLCMAYPIETLGETNFDLRMIAILVVTLYAGWVPGLITVIIVSIIRIIIGGTFLHIGVLVSVTAFIIALIFRRRFHLSTFRILNASCIALIYLIIYIVIIYFSVSFLELTFYIVYFIAFFVTFISIIYIIETLIKFNKQFDEMVYMDKLTTTGQMAASIAHEIRNPITTVRGFIQFMQQDTVDEKLKQFSPLILEELDRTNMIITNYLKLAKPEPFELSNVNIDKILMDSIELLRPLGTFSNVTLEYDNAENCYVKGDTQHIKQSLLNVIKNAIESIDKRGVVKISNLVDYQNEVVTIVIKDNGKGMTKDELKQIGLPFYTTKTKGTGLGSMITNRLIRQLGGTIDYESELGKGTTVTITFQLVSKKS
ncbi:ATP-binding protein [Metabacillus litoralis]|uniref:ATP-binding protein n=1 Tax=Metabacillus litoralis TaxID=152268 RepID=UPI00308427CE